MKKPVYLLLLAASLAGCGASTNNTSGAKVEDGKSPVRDSASLKNRQIDSTKSTKSNTVKGNADPSGHNKNQ